MIRVQAEQLSTKGIGKFIAIYEADGRLPTESTSFAKIVQVVPDMHLLTLEKFGGANDGEQFFAYYKVGTSVDVYEEDEAVLLAFRNFDDSDPENRSDYPVQS
jgi:hypothetical protein